MKIDEQNFTNNLLCRRKEIFSDSEDILQISMSQLDGIERQYNLKIYTSKTKAMAFGGQNHILCKLVISFIHSQALIVQDGPLASLFRVS
jgi:hypothetical protein